jgi:programmed cell death 6-interacting protein
MFPLQVQDFCFARRTEKEELLKDLNANIARQPAAGAPKAPAYQQAGKTENFDWVAL